MPYSWTRGKYGPTIPGPQNFDPGTSFTNADFTQSIYVQVAYNPDRDITWDYTVAAFTFVNNVNGFTICEVAHAHITGDITQQASWGPGNGYTPGLQGFSLPTPIDVVNYLYQTYNAAINTAAQQDPELGGLGLILHGTFPKDNRYPH